jgi:hypothetical protein
MNDPRGPIKVAIKVEPCPNGGPTAVTLSCGHTRNFNAIYTYCVGEQHRCLACKDEADYQVVRENNV